MNSRSIVKTILPAFLSALAACFFFSLLFHSDNKYKRALPSFPGVNLLSEEQAERVSFLVDNWEFYPGSLLSPSAFSGQNRPEGGYTYIGEYPNFSGQVLPTEDTPGPGSPFGTATYRLNLQYDGPETVLSLYLPEVLSASRVYINGREAGAAGSVSPYHPFIQDRIYSFEAGAHNELIIQTSNHSHYYSGMYYPPAIGGSQAVFRMAAERIAVYGIFCFGSLAVALSNLAAWLLGAGGLSVRRLRGKRSAAERESRRAGSADRPVFYLGALCLAFSARTAYPLFHLWGVHAVNFFYALEDLCGALVLLFSILIAAELSRAANDRLYRVLLLPCGAAMCAVCVVFPVFILPHAPALINIYGAAISIWKLLAAAWLMLISLRGLLRGSSLNGYLLTASTLYGLSMSASVLTIARFEPASGGWPEEYGGFFLVLVFSAMMVQNSRNLMSENERLTRQLEKEVDKKTAALTTLLDGRRQFLADIVHDLKTPLTALENYAQLIRSSEAELDEETCRYLDAIDARMEVVNERFGILREFSSGERENLNLIPVCLNDFLRKFYQKNQPDIEMGGQTFELLLPGKHLTIPADPKALTRVLENLCYNALSFTPDSGKISLILREEEEWASITVSDTGEGIAAEDLPRIFERHFSRREGDTDRGLGLFIAKSIVVEHGGEISVQSEKNRETAFTVRLPLSKAPDSGSRYPS